MFDYDGERTFHLSTYNSVSVNDSGRKEMKRMKAGIHPTYNKITVKCACGKKFAEAGGRVDRFNKKYGIKNQQQ